MTMTHQRADDTLNETLRGTATPHLWLHTGDPGAAGTANVAQTDAPADIDRKAISFAAPENHPTNVERRVLSDAAVEWSGAEIDSGQTITHFSIWDGSAGGQPEFIGEVDEAKEVGGDGVSISSGDIEAAISVHVKP